MCRRRLNQTLPRNADVLNVRKNQLCVWADLELEFKKYIHVLVAWDAQGAFLNFFFQICGSPGQILWLRLWVRHYLQLWEGLLHTGWTGLGWRSTGKKNPSLVSRNVRRPSHVWPYKYYSDSGQISSFIWNLIQLLLHEIWPEFCYNIWTCGWTLCGEFSNCFITLFPLFRRLQRKLFWNRLNTPTITKRRRSSAWRLRMSVWSEHIWPKKRQYVGSACQAMSRKWQYVQKFIRFGGEVMSPSTVLGLGLADAHVRHANWSIRVQKTEHKVIKSDRQGQLGFSAKS